MELYEYCVVYLGSHQQNTAWRPHYTFTFLLIPCTFSLTTFVYRWYILWDTSTPTLLPQFWRTAQDNNIEPNFGKYEKFLRERIAYQTITILLQIRKPFRFFFDMRKYKNTIPFIYTEQEKNLYSSEISLYSQLIINHIYFTFYNVMLVFTTQFP